MGKLSLGNKKSVVCFGISAYQLKIPQRIISVLQGTTGAGDAAAGLMEDITANPMALAPAAVGYWVLGKPYRGKL